MKILLNIKNFFIKYKTLLIAAGVAAILFAAFFVYNAVSFKEIIVVCSDASVSDGVKDINGNTLKVFEKIPDAIDYLGGQEGTIYIKGNIKATTLESKAENRGEITFQGYLGLADGNTLTVSNADALYKGNITFKNITLNNANNNEGFYSTGNVITFESGVVTGNNGIKTINLGSGGVTAGNNNINIYSGNFGNLSAFYGLTEGKDYTINTTYNIYGGTINNAIMGAYSDTAGVTKILGNVTYNINGGVIENLSMGAHSESHISYVLGNTVVNVNGGKFSNGINFADTSSAAFSGDLDNTQSHGNIVLIINSANVENSFEIFNKDNIGKNMLKAENKRFAAIINNYHAGNVKFSENLEHIDYKITVTGGTAEPVFEQTDESAPESAILVGFKIKSNDTQNKYLVPRINGNKACLKDNTDYYDLSSYEKSNIINIDFVEDKIPVLTNETNFTPNENELAFDTISSTLDYVGISGGKIAVKGNVSLENLTVSGSVQNPVTFFGYNGSEAHINLAGSDWSGFNGNLNFENIQVTFNNNDSKFISGGKTITCQNGVVSNGELDLNNADNSVYYLNGGNFSGIKLPTQENGSLVVIDGDGFSSNIVLKSQSVKNNVNSVFIINNAENKNVKFEDNIEPDNSYKILVNQGFAEPVYETPNNINSKILGFKVYSDYVGVKPYINGQELQKLNGKEYYNLSGYKNSGVIEITFKADYGEYWVKNGGIGDGSSPKYAAKSVKWLINNVIADNHSANETVNVYIMQDDDAIKNTTISGFTPWETATDTENKPHTAKIVIKSYQNANGAKNYLAAGDSIGIVNDMDILGPTVFDDVILLSMQNHESSISANGNNLEFTANTAYNALEFDSVWNGLFTSSGQNNGFKINVGNSLEKSEHKKGVININSIYDAQSSNHIRIGSYFAEDTFDEDINIYVNSVISGPVCLGSGSVEHNNTFNKNVNIIVNEPAKLTVKIDGNMPIINGALQIIRNSEGVVNGNEDISKFSGNCWNLKTYEYNGAFLDVTETAGTFKVVNGPYVAVAVNEQGEVTVSDNGYLTIPAGRYNVYFANSLESGYINTGTEIYAFRNTPIDLTKEPHTFKEDESAFAFLGWQYSDGTIPKKNLILKGGELLKAVYSQYSNQLNGDFYIKNAEMRFTNNQPDGIRFIVNKNNSMLEKLGGSANIIDYGTLLMPTEYSHGKDLVYGEVIYSNHGHTIRGYANTERERGEFTYNDDAILGTPLAVKAEKIYGKSQDALLYTACVNNISNDKYYRFYGAQGYIRYYDINGIEQVAYSNYLQTNYYKTALEAANTAQYAQNQGVLSIINYVENERKAAFNKLLYQDNQKGVVLSALNVPNLEIYRLYNNVIVSEFTIDWYSKYSKKGEDSLPTSIVQLTDNHINYVNDRDFGEANEAVMSTYENRIWCCEGASAQKTIYGMNFASFADKIVLTGDMMDYLSNGCLQITKRLMFDCNTNVGIYSNKNSKIFATLGNHEATKTMEGVVDDAVSTFENYKWLQKYWPNNIHYQSDIVTNKNGKNAVMVVALDNSTALYRQEEIFINLRADLEKARNNNLPVLLFQHIPLSDGTTDTTKGLLIPTLEHSNASACGGVNRTDDLTSRVYNLITDNADIIKGVFAGHEHEYFYNEIKGTGKAKGLTIPQHICPSAIYGDGYIMKINVN